ncbi:acyl dehydratase [Spongiibacter sp. IMCC21906]|uniref:MaoC/PaaZ C-terminal domain-containing protein n=1 Tax=Spongiibacter sp. IMCC21906 TaxID=1620392 RepID=UPI00062DDCFB|nr:MaoC/PaaZ C-terminal domain-containing protein [Spongiibacter sp. IMCC21906]AKH69077.1 acyl dehydratase [Spongiibacter sp. IMCC21906]
MKYFEDFKTGQTFIGDAIYTITEQEIIDYAREWDPQAFHIDSQAAAKTEIGKIFASALHTQAITNKLAHANGFYNIAMVAGFGVDEMRTPRPVFGGDKLTLKLSIFDVKESRSRPHQGIVTFAFAAYNQLEQPVMSYRLTLLINRRGKRK